MAMTTCPVCGTAGTQAFCQNCGTALTPPGSLGTESAPTQMVRQGHRSIIPIVLATFGGLFGLGLAVFLLMAALLSPHSSTPVDESAPSVSESYAADPTDDGSAYTDPEGDVGQSSSSDPSDSSSTTDDEATATSQLDSWASEGLSSIDVAEDSWAVRLSSKWVGATDEAAGHPDPYTAEEIEQEYSSLRERYGADLRIVKTGDVGLQNDAIAGKDGWMALVVNSDTSTEAKAKAWCEENYGGDLNQCGIQHLNAPHMS